MVFEIDLGKENVTQFCFDWCKDQHFQHHQYLGEDSFMILIILTAILLTSYITSCFKWVIIDKTGLTEQQFNSIIYSVMLGAAVLLMGFMAYHIYIIK